MDDVADLVLTPFKDIVEKGKTAVENAGGEQPMLKASQNLVKEGERALKRIEPVCQKHCDEYGSNFLDALKENDEIAQHRSELNDLLWDFDDFITPDDFDEEKYTELKAKAQQAAKKIYEILMRLKLEAPPKREPPEAVLRPAGSPPPLNVPKPISQASIPALERDVESQLQQMMTPQPSPDQLRLSPDHHIYAEKALPATPKVQKPPREPPRPPSANPWDMNSTPAGDIQTPAGPVERRKSVSIMDSPVLPHANPSRPSSVNSNPRTDSQEHESRQQGSTSGNIVYSIDNRTYLSSQRRSGSTRSQHPTIPEDAVPNNGLAFPMPPLPANPSANGQAHSPMQQFPLRSSSNYCDNSDLGRQRSMESLQSSVFDVRRITAYSDGPVSPATTDNRQSMLSAKWSAPSEANSPVVTASQHTLMPTPPYVHSVPAMPEYTPAPEPVMPQMEYFDAPIPLATENQPAEITRPVTRASPERNLSLRTDSSFYQYRGFCTGAQDVMRGGLGIEKKRRQLGFTGTHIVAKCTGCFYELDYKQIELDVGQSDAGNFVTHKVGFRIRFLQKSHIATKRIDENLYACLFCVHEAKTVHESDATVFFTQKQLFTHLARHPRPLPEVPGLIVFEGERLPQNLRNNYDLHFKLPAETNPVTEHQDRINQLPTATAKDTVKISLGMRLLPDRTAALEMAAGAKIVGVEFIPKWNGEWCMGWHDGLYASFPFSIVKLEPPPSGDIRMHSNTGMKVTAKWRFKPATDGKDKADWLRFDKDEVITNVNYVSRDYWCWSGTNSKGKWGIFPQSHVDTSTLQDGGSDRSSIMSNEKAGGGARKKMFSLRSKGSQSRPGSSSNNSQETLSTHRPSVY